MTIAIPIAKAMVERNMMMDGFDVHIMTDRSSGSYSIMQELSPPIIRIHHDGEYVERKPAFMLPRASAQALMDAMWEAGIRPSETAQKEQDKDGMVEALRDHLRTCGESQCASSGFPCRLMSRALAATTYSRRAFWIKQNLRR